MSKLDISSRRVGGIHLCGATVVSVRLLILTCYLFGLSVTADYSGHTCTCCSWYLREPIGFVGIVQIGIRMSAQKPSSFFARRVSLLPWCRGSCWTGNKERSKSRNGHHENRDTALLLLPEGRPDNINATAASWLHACNFSYGYDYHGA